MAVHASHAALPYPIKNARYTVDVVFLDADGDPTDPVTPDTEISKDNGNFADCTEEVAVPATNRGGGMMTFSGAETDCSTAKVWFGVASGPKITMMTLQPRPLPIVGSGTLSAGSAGGGTLGTILAYDITGCFIRTTGGTGGGGTGGANNQARRIVTYNTSTGAFTVSPNWETTPSTDTTYDILLPESVTLGMLKAVNPTTAGRTLDVSTGGEAGVDWANVGSPTTTVGLSGTTVKTATDVIAATDAIKGDTAAILVDTGTTLDAALAVVDANVDAILVDTGATLDGRIPAALVGGRMDSSVGAMAANVVTASALATDACDEIVDAVWDEDVDTHHQTAGSAGKKLDDAGGAADPWATALPGAYGAGTAGKIVGDNINATISSRATQTSVDAIAGYVDTEVAAIKAKTDNLPSDPADESLIIAATDVIMSRLGAPAGASIAADIATRATPAQVNTEADTAIADARLNQLLAASVAAPVAGSLFAELTEDDGGVQRFTVNALEQGPGGGSSETRNREGTAQAGGANTITLDAGASAVNDFYKNQRCAIVGGTGSGECEIIASYVGSTKVATMAASWATAPDATSQFRILPLGTIPGASAPTADAVAEATLDKLATQKTTMNRDTGEIKAFKADLVTVRGTRRITEIDSLTQALIPQ